MKCRLAMRSNPWRSTPRPVFAKGRDFSADHKGCVTKRASK